ncbi:MAG: hypothetical protein LVQ75_01185 [Candidatus Babeliales bacterium]|jgi:hypothetical protein
MKKQLYSYLILVIFAYQTRIYSTTATITQHDFYPLHATLYPFDFLNEQRKAAIKGMTHHPMPERMRFCATAFGQKATLGRDQDKVECPAGDIHGRWNMVGLTYGTVPTGHTLPALLTAAAGQTYQDGQLLSHENYSDVNDHLGHFSIPLRYIKMGARFDFSVRIFSDIVLQVQTGIADIKQTHTKFLDQGDPLVYTTAIPVQDIYGSTAAPADLVADRATIANWLMDPHELIFEQMGLNIQDFHATGPEDVLLSLIWRHNFAINKPGSYDQSDDEFNRDHEWSQFIMTPFFKVTGIVGIGKEKDQTKAFSIPFGNNKHNGVSIATGLSMDFYETIEFTWQAGASHFFKRDISGMYVPNDERQRGVFPFKTDVSYAPGKTWFFTCALNAYHFMEKLSFYTEYIYTSHAKDTVKLLTPDTAFKPHVLEDHTKWAVQAMNIGFNYDFSPYMKAGFTWQAPLVRRGAYKTNTLAVTLAGTF